MLARRFLWIITALVLIVVAGALVYRLFAPALMREVFVPDVAFKPAPVQTGSAYADPGMWLARPDLNPNPSLWTPQGFEPTQASKASVFFIHPTSYIESSGWNAPLDDPDSQSRALLFIRSQASAFNSVGAVWAPKYRQATAGAFLTDKPEAEMAAALAYRDVLAAFDAFLDQAPKDLPIILAGHSQGSLHLSRLLAERVAGQPVARRIVAAYVIGWPVSLTLDVPELGLPACERPDQSGCILAWQTFAEPADPQQLIDIYEASAGPNGTSRAGTPILCINPLTGTQGASAGAELNLGTLIPDASFSNADLRPGLVPARCDSRGLLLIGEEPPPLPRFVLPGNNYHVFDYALFWANVRADAERRMAGYSAR